MTFVFLLEHLLLASIVSALNGSVVALTLVPFQVQVINDFLAALVSVLTASLNPLELLQEKRMGINKLERWIATVGACHFVVTLNQLVDVIIDMLPTEAFAALVALSWIQHNILAQDAVKESIMFNFSICGSCIRLDTLDLLRIQCCFPHENERA